MAHLLRTGSSIFKVGNSIFGIRDRFTYQMQNATGGGTLPQAVAVDPVAANNRFLTCNQTSNTVSIFNANTLAFVSAITGFSTPQDICFDPVAANNRFAVANFGGTVAIVNATTGAITNTINTGTSGIYSVCFDPVAANNRLFICHNTLNVVMVYNATTFAFISSFSVTQAFKIRVDPIVANNRLFVTGQGKLYIHDATSFALLAGPITVTNGSGIAFDPDTSSNRVFIGTTSTRIDIFSTVSLGVIGTIPGFTSVSGIDFDPVIANNRFFTVQNNSTVSRITQTAS